jgi:hypothetical protein
LVCPWARNYYVGKTREDYRAIMAEHNSKTSLAKIVKFNKQNPDEYETVGTLIKGQSAVIRKLHQ